LERDCPAPPGGILPYRPALYHQCLVIAGRDTGIQTRTKHFRRHACLAAAPDSRRAGCGRTSLRTADEMRLGLRVQLTGRNMRAPHHVPEPAGNLRAGDRRRRNWKAKRGCPPGPRMPCTWRRQTHREPVARIEPRSADEMRLGLAAPTLPGARCTCTPPYAPSGWQAPTTRIDEGRT
jgi:hypothetical protein